MVNALPVMSITAGICTMVVISVERARCVLPARGQAVPTPNSRSIGLRCTIITLAVVWVWSIVVAVPVGVNFDIGAYHVNGSNHSVSVCQPTWSSLQTSIYSLFLLVVSYLLPQAVLYVKYGRVAAYLWRSHRAVVPTSGQPQASSSTSTGQTGQQGGRSASKPIARSTLNTIKMLMTVSILFLASWAPYFTIMTIEVIRFLLFV